MATLTLCDIYKRYFRSNAGERESMWVLRTSTLIWGMISTATALTLIDSINALDVRWQLAGIFSGGVLGLVLLGMMSRTATGRTGLIATVSGLLIICWMT